MRAIEVRVTKVKLINSPDGRLVAFCNIVIDNSFVINDLKVIRGPHCFFVVMPDRKLTDKCPSCGGKNHLRARYCNSCGTRLEEKRVRISDSGKPILFADVVHPLNSETRRILEDKVLEAFEREQLLDI